MRHGQWRAVAILAAALAGCASSPTPPSHPVSLAYDPASIIAAIDRASVADTRELVVRPLADSQAAGVYQDVNELQAQGRFAEAAVSLDSALQERPNDPALLQARAESAVMQGDLQAAEQFARRAAAAGTQAGPNCRRHWETVAQVLAVQLTDGYALGSARASRDACTVAAPPRY